MPCDEEARFAIRQIQAIKQAAKPISLRDIGVACLGRSKPTTKLVEVLRQLAGRAAIHQWPSFRRSRTVDGCASGKAREPDHWARLGREGARRTAKSAPARYTECAGDSPRTPRARPAAVAVGRKPARAWAATLEQGEDHSTEHPGKKYRPDDRGDPPFDQQHRPDLH